MHKSIRNITRLFERIQDFEKRVVKRRGASSTGPTPRPSSPPWRCWRGRWFPFAPHVAEELLVALGVEDTAEALEAWPESAEIPVSPQIAPAS